MSDHPAEPTLSERARTALARARFGSLVTKGCALRPGTLTVVAIEDQPDGRPLVHLEESSPIVRVLGACRVATLSVASAAPFRNLELTGPLLPRRGSQPGHRSFRLSPLTVRLIGGTIHSLHPSDFQAAKPDPLAGLAPAFLHYLTDAHASDLLNWIRAQGYEHADAVLPRQLDRYGIELAVLGAAGVQRVRLTFPDGPIDNIEQAPPGLSAPPGCHHHGSGS